jgi:phosphatidylglycerophosphate synthase
LSTWKQNGQQLVYTIINPLIKGLLKIGVTPNMITLIGLFLNAFAAAVFILGAEFGQRDNHSYVAWAGFIILLGGLMDMIDGRLARVGNLANPYGALFDSVLDRYSEMIMFLGICYYLISYDYFLSSLFAFIAMIGSIMVSYTRAKAESLGINCSVGIMQRPERILIVGITAILAGGFSGYLGGDVKIDVDFLPFPIFEIITIFTFPLFLLAIFTNITAINRLIYSKRELQKINKV